MFNTFGLRSVNTGTFNSKRGDTFCSYKTRDKYVTLLRINNLVFNILGYVEKTRGISGCIRMAVGTGMLAVVAIAAHPDDDKGAFRGPWYYELQNTLVAQIARGGIEAFVPQGRTINLALDMIGTLANIIVEFRYDKSSYSDPKCSRLLEPLRLV